jgi:hypothetical protein
MKEGEHHQATMLLWRKAISLEPSNPWETDSYTYYTLTQGSNVQHLVKQLNDDPGRQQQPPPHTARHLKVCHIFHYISVTSVRQHS